MVRRGSPVRVRKRALRKRRTVGAFPFTTTCSSSNVQRVGSPLWSLQVQNAWSRTDNRDHSRSDSAGEGPGSSPAPPRLVIRLTHSPAGAAIATEYGIEILGPPGIPT